MDYIESELFSFCEISNLESCLIIIKNMLRKNNQIATYDSIYDRFIEDKTDKKLDPNVYIEGLDGMIKLMIFTQIYKNLLFPKTYSDSVLNDKDFKEITERDINMYVEILIDEEQYSFKKFILTSNKILNINCENEEDNEYYEYVFGRKSSHFSFPDNWFCFPYILIHKACNLSFESLSDMLFGNPNYTRSPIGFKLFNDKIGPHGNSVLEATEFFKHDLQHSQFTALKAREYNMIDFYNTLQPLTKGCFEKRVLDILFICKIFETEKVFGNVCKDIYLFPITIKKTYDINDIIHVYEYLFSASDIEMYIDNIEDFKIKFLDYKAKFRKIQKLKYLISYDRSFIINKYIEIDCYDESDTKKQVILKIQKTLDRLDISKFLNIEFFNYLEEKYSCVTI